MVKVNSTGKYEVTITGTKKFGVSIETIRLEECQCRLGINEK